MPFTNIHHLKKLVLDLKKYKATPWNNIEQKPYDWTSAQREQYVKECECRTDYTKEECRNICQWHGGNLYEHSFWCMLYTKQLFDHRDVLVYGLKKYKDELLVGSFFHDIGKGGDLIYDMYSNQKYDGQGDNAHPKWCGNMILGNILYKYSDGTTLNIHTLLTQVFPHVDIKKSGIDIVYALEIWYVECRNE